MITDSDTNFLYLSPLLEQNYKSFFNRFIRILNEHKTEYGFLPATKDVWALDYMPIQIGKEDFIQFIYYPDYLRKYKKWLKTISHPEIICQEIHIYPGRTDIILDGGNIIRNKTMVIMTNKIFQENPHYQKNRLVEEIERLLGLRLIIIPTEPEDWIGHADGIVRFLNGDTVLINNYKKEKGSYYWQLEMALKNAGLQYIEIPYNPYPNKNNTDASGIYINFLEMENIIYIPVFGLKEDDQVFQLFETLFAGQQVIPVDSKEIAKEGGVLNCISWNIKI